MRDKISCLRSYFDNFSTLLQDWIWWNKKKNLVATESGRTTSVLREGEAILEDGLRVWHPGDDDPNSADVGGANLPLDGGGAGDNNARN